MLWKMWCFCRRVVVVLFCLQSLSCQKNPEKKSIDPITQPGVAPADAGGYQLEDADCRQNAAIEQIFTHELRHQVEHRASDPPKGFIAKPLSSPFIEETLFAAQINRSCAGGSCRLIALEKAGQAVSLCRPKAQYRRGSVEDVSLSALKSLEDFSLYYKKVSQGDALSPIKLHIFSQLVDQKTIGTDNLIYSSALEGGRAIYILPKSSHGEAIWPNVQLWESPWILAHEASHHVFFERLTKGDSPLAGALGMVPILKDKGHSGLRLGADLEGVIAAWQEGFADLLAFYAVGEDPSSFERLACFGPTRNPKSSVFTDGLLKAFDGDNLRKILSQTEGRSGSCSVTDLSEIHDLGGLFARQFYELFGSEGGDLALEHVDEMMNKSDRLPLAPENLIGAILEEAVFVALKRHGRERVCQVARQGFPYYLEFGRLRELACGV